MAGHSHWANIQRRKAGVDAQKGKFFSKCARQITIAARQGGGDPDSNITLKYAIDKARAISMPRDNIERAIKKGTGELGAENIESVIYEAIGPGGVFILIDILTDNRNRTAPEIRKILERKDARMGSVGWAFEKKGLLTVSAAQVPEDRLMEIILDAGAEDMQRVGNAFQVTTNPADLEKVRRALVEQKIAVDSCELTMLPNSQNVVDEETGRKVLSLLEQLEEHDDVQNVYSNVELPESLLAEMSAKSA